MRLVIVHMRFVPGVAHLLQRTIAQPQLTRAERL
jgi:hypothetical protein